MQTRPRFTMTQMFVGDQVAYVCDACKALTCDRTGHSEWHIAEASWRHEVTTALTQRRLWYS
jgi:hypothetical protein